MSITYEEALATLQSMFSEPWTRDLLDEVLRHEKGHMENTVDLILRHGDKEPKVLVSQLTSGIDPLQSAVAADEALARQLSQATTRRMPRPKQAAATGKGKSTTLPDDFLRVPGVAPVQSSLQDDEALARMLQDELFTEELRRNPDFAHLARGRSNAALPSSNQGNQPNPGAVAAAAAEKINEFATRLAANVSTTMSNVNSNINQSISTRSVAGGGGSDGVTASPNVMEKLSDLGDSAKRRLQLLAAQFNAQNGGKPASSTQRSEFRGLLDDDDDNDNMELAARKDL